MTTKSGMGVTTPLFFLPAPVESTSTKGTHYENELFHGIANRSSLNKRIRPHMVVGGTNHPTTTNMGITFLANIMEECLRQVVLEMLLPPA